MIFMIPDDNEVLYVIYREMKWYVTLLWGKKYLHCCSYVTILTMMPWEAEVMIAQYVASLILIFDDDDVDAFSCLADYEYVALTTDDADDDAARTGLDDVDERPWRNTVGNSLRNDGRYAVRYCCLVWWWWCGDVFVASLFYDARWWKCVDDTALHLPFAMPALWKWVVPVAVRCLSLRYLAEYYWYSLRDDDIDIAVLPTLTLLPIHYLPHYQYYLVLLTLLFGICWWRCGLRCCSIYRCWCDVVVTCRLRVFWCR